MRSLLKSFKIKIYDEDTGYGLLRYVLIRKAEFTDEIMVVLVTCLLYTSGAICKKLAAKHGCCLVDLQEVFNRYFEYRHSSYIAWDRVHPNLIGATVIAKAFLSHCGFEYDHQPAKKETQTC